VSISQKLAEIRKNLTEERQEAGGRRQEVRGF